MDTFSSSRISNNIEDWNEESGKVSVAIELACDIDDVLTYALIHNDVNIVREVCLKNISEVDIEHIIFKIESNNSLIENFELNIDKIKSGEILYLKNLKIRVNADYLVSLTERITCNLKIKVCLFRSFCQDIMQR